eukprot:s5696_g4.t1
MIAEVSHIRRQALVCAAAKRGVFQLWILCRESLRNLLWAVKAKASIARWTGVVGGGRTSSSRVRFALPSPSPAVPTRRPQRGLGGEQRARDLLDVME